MFCTKKIQDALASKCKTKESFKGKPLIFTLAIQLVLSFIPVIGWTNNIVVSHYECPEFIAKVMETFGNSCISKIII